MTNPRIPKYSPTALSLLALDDVQQRLSSQGVSVPDVNAALATANEEARAAATQEIADTLIALGKEADNLVTTWLNEQAALEQQLAGKKALLDHLQRTRLYHEQTGNANPYLIALGKAVFIPPTVPESLRKIPDNWTPTSEVSEAQ